MNEIIKGNNSLLPNGYAQWRKDIEHLIDTAKLHTALNVNVGTLTLYYINRSRKVGANRL